MVKRVSLAAAAVLAAMLATAPPAHAYGGVDICHSTAGCPSPVIYPLRSALPGLATIDQEFVNGDHHIRRLAVFPRRGHYGSFLDPALHFVLEDSNADDGISGEVNWVDLRQHSLLSVAGNCQGTCNLPIPALPAGDSIALLGIDFSYTSGTDHHVQEISVVPAPQLGFITVSFRDGAASAPFRATIHYARLVALEISSIVSLSSSTPAIGSVTGTRPTGNAVLRGFRLAFTNGDHHLERWSVDLCGEEPSCGGMNDFVLRFRDGNGDDPFNWFLSFTILRPGVDG
jgi:hypothetical protein